MADRRRVMTVAITDFWPGHHPPTDPILSYLKEHHEVKVLDEDSQEEPDLLYCSVMGTNKSRFKCKKLLLSGENYLRPGGNGAFIDLSEFDFVMLTNSNHLIKIPEDTRYLHLPWMMYERPLPQLIEDRDSRGKIEPSDLTNKKFCCFIVSNGYIGDGCKPRDDIFSELSRYKRVDSAGSHLNNMGSTVPREGFIDWISQYKFIICFENSLSPGYLTEKISQAYRAKVIPIYCSDSSAKTWLNPDSMVFHEPGSDISTAISRIIDLDKNDDLYCETVNSNPFTAGGEELFSWSRVDKFLDDVTSSL